MPRTYFCSRLKEIFYKYIYLILINYPKPITIIYFYLFFLDMLILYEYIYCIGIFKGGVGMVSSRENEYIIRCKSMFFYFYLINNVIYIERSEDGLRGKRKKLISDIKDFSVDLDGTNTINIVCLDTSDRLYHLYHKEKKWRKRFIIDLRVNSIKLRDLRLFIDRDKLNILCLKSHIPKKNIWRLVHYTFHKRTWSSCDIGNVKINKYLSTYKVDIDNNFNIHIIYRPVKNNKHEFFYRVFNSKHRKWSLAAKLGSHPSDIINMNILCDTQNVVHVTWSCLEGKNIAVNYFRKVISFSLAKGWHRSKTFPKTISNFTNSVLLQDNNYIKLIWKQNDCLYLTETPVGKDMWCSIRKVENILDYPLKPIVYIGEVYKDFKTVKVPLSYGYFDEEIFILGLDRRSQQESLPNILSENSNKKPTKNDKNKKHKNDIDENLIKYIEAIKPQLPKEEVVSDIFSDKDTASRYGEALSDDIADTVMDEMMLKLFDLYDKINDLKEQEFEFSNQLEMLKDDQFQLNERIEKIFDTCWRIK